MKNSNSFLTASLIAVGLFGGILLSGCGNNQENASASPTSTPSAAAEGAETSRGAGAGATTGKDTSMSSPQNALNNPSLSAETKDKIREHMKSSQNQPR